MSAAKGVRLTEALRIPLILLLLSPSYLQGEEGQDMYVVEEGSLEVIIDGEVRLLRSPDGHKPVGSKSLTIKV